MRGMVEGTPSIMVGEGMVTGGSRIEDRETTRTRRGAKLHTQRDLLPPVRTQFPKVP